MERSGISVVGTTDKVWKELYSTKGPGTKIQRAHSAAVIFNFFARMSRNNGAIMSYNNK